MAGSYAHAVMDDERLRNPRTMSNATENQGDAYETIEEMYGMIWFLADGDSGLVERARANYLTGIALSPGTQDDDD